MFDNVFTNKIVAFIITPIITGIMAWFIPWAEQHLPGTPDLDDNGITALAIAGVVTGFGISLKFLHELAAWQKLKQFGSIDTNVPLEGVVTDELEQPTTPDVGDAGKP